MDDVLNEDMRILNVCNPMLPLLIMHCRKLQMRHGSLYVGSTTDGSAVPMAELVSLEDASVVKAIDPDDGTERIVISYKSHLVRDIINFSSHHDLFVH